MLPSTFDPMLPYRGVVYGRMSDPGQNQRSPDQQKAEVERTIQAKGYPWTIVDLRRDDGITGQINRGRPGFQQMLLDIKTGVLDVDLILVDTNERLGRNEDLAPIRKRLYERFGVTVLCADSGFVDPHTPHGKILRTLEDYRAVEDNRIRAHQVMRGKRDAIKQGHWPGGRVPLGLALQSVLKTVHGREEVDYCLVVKDPETNWIVVLLFDQAERTGWGSVRLAKYLNGREDIPARLKPFNPWTVGHMLDCKLYFGFLEWNVHATGVVDESRRLVKNRDEDIVRRSDFCEATVSDAQWRRVAALRDVRRRRSTSTQNGTESDKKYIAPLAHGLALAYLLSGLVFCGECGRRMVISSTKPFITKDGESRKYAAYCCPGRLGGGCTNTLRVPEELLRTWVVERLRDRLFVGLT